MGREKTKQNTHKTNKAKQYRLGPMQKTQQKVSALKLSCSLLVWLSEEQDCGWEWHFLQQTLQTVVMQDIPLKVEENVKSYCTLDLVYVAQNSAF